MQSSLSRRALLNYAGITILLAGLACAEFIYWRGLQRAGGAQPGDDSLALLADSKAYDRAVETQVGVFGSMLIQCDRALAKLGDPGPLAITICAFSTVAAGGCFLAASRMPRG